MGLVKLYRCVTGQNKSECMMDYAMIAQNIHYL